MIRESGSVKLRWFSGAEQPGRGQLLSPKGHDVSFHFLVPFLPAPYFSALLLRPFPQQLVVLLAPYRPSTRVSWPGATLADAALPATHHLVCLCRKAHLLPRLFLVLQPTSALLRRPVPAPLLSAAHNSCSATSKRSP